MLDELAIAVCREKERILLAK